MVTAAGPPILPAGLEPDEIAINAWLAEDLEAEPGDTLELRYFALGMARRLEEQSARFRIHSVVPMDSEGGRSRTDA
jgi:putative ABC transport system permease protein